MSESIDVPAVLLRMQHILHSIGPAASDDAATLRKARFAIGELIQAAEAYADSCYHVGNHDRLIDALAVVTPNPRSRSQEQEREE